VSKFNEAVARMRAGLEIAEDAIRTIGAISHHVAEGLADKVRDFRDGYEQGRRGDDDAAK